MDVQDKIREQVTKHRVVLYMKASRNSDVRVLGDGRGDPQAQRPSTTSSRSTCSSTPRYARASRRTRTGRRSRSSTSTGEFVGGADIMARDVRIGRVEAGAREEARLILRVVPSRRPARRAAALQVRARCTGRTSAMRRRLRIHGREVAAVAHTARRRTSRSPPPRPASPSRSRRCSPRRRRSPWRGRRAAHGGRRPARARPASYTPSTSVAHSTSTSSAASTRCFFSVTHSRVWTTRPCPCGTGRRSRRRESPAALRVLDRHALDAAQREPRPASPVPACRPRPGGRRGASAPARRRTTAACRGPMSARISSWLFAPYLLRAAPPALARDRLGIDLQRRERLTEQALAERRRLLLLQPLR